MKFKQGNRHRASKFSTLINQRSSGNGEGVFISSVVSQLIWTNDPPSEIERTDIELAISRAEKKKEELRTSLAQSNSSGVSRIPKTLKELDTFINTHKPILSTMRHLPFDVLSYIFTLCLEPIRTRPWVQTQWYTIPSFPLSQVCRWWRSVALETPILWTFLGDVRLHQKSGSKFGYSYTNFLETLLRRSKSLDLWIYVHAPFQELDTHRAIAPLVSHSDRWRVVTFKTRQSIVAAFRGVHHRLPRLQSLSLNLCQGGSRESIPLHLFSDAPSLTEVTIPGLSPEIELPWGQLKSFDEQSDAERGSQLEHIFNHSTDSLEHLTVTLRPILLLYALTTPPVTFSKLKSLRLIPTGDLDDCCYFIHALTMPCLEELHMDNGSPLLDFFRRSFAHSRRSPLKRLTLHNSQSPSYIAELLRLVPHLEYFEVGLSAARGVLREMSGVGEPLLPELKTLLLRWDCWEKDFEDFDTFAALTSSRCKRSETEPAEYNNSARTLTDISLIFPSPRQPFWYQRYLNNWCGNDEGDHIRLYDDWQDTLMFHFSLGRYPASNTAAGINGVLSAIETSVPHEVNHIYASQTLRESLRTLSVSNRRLVPGDLRKRAKAIIKSWDAIVQADITALNSPWSKNWVRRSELTLRYLPDNHIKDISDLFPCFHRVG